MAGVCFLVVVCVVALFVAAEKELGRTVQCRGGDRNNHRFCRFQHFRCPPSCPFSCSVDCVTCRPICDCDKPGAVCQDPKFIGADGITFYFHGKRDRDFCVVADSNLHINAHFIGRRNPILERDFTWVQSLGIIFDDHKLYVGAMKTSTWKDSVDRVKLSFDDESVYLPNNVGETWKSTSSIVSITRVQDTNSVEIKAEGKFKIKATVVPITKADSLIHNYGVIDDDCFAHLDLIFKFYSLTDKVSGVLGQTYAQSYVSRAKMGTFMPVLGGEKEFASSNIFSTDCSVARFVGKGIDALNLSGIVDDLICAGGVGVGVVCKR